MRRKAATIALYALVLVGIPALLLEYGRMPPIAGRGLWIVFGLWTVFFGWRFVRARRRKQGGALAFNLAFLCLALFVGEGLAHRSTRGARLEISPRATDYVRRDPDLGYTPRPGVEARFRKVAGDDLVFDVTYHIEADGLRRRPPVRDPEASIVLFGCSFAYGMGLEDEATIAYRLEEAVAGRYRVLNLGFSGWGPHQMLANLESGRVERLAVPPPKLAIYLAIEDHARRIAGVAAHDRHGPRYVPSDDGLLRRAGGFDDDAVSTFGKRLVRLLHHSQLATAILRSLEKTRGDVELVGRAAKTAEVRVKERWPGCRFVVLLWDEPAHDVGPLRESLRRRDLDVIPVSRFLPALLTDPASCWIHEADKHPNAEAAAAIAKGIAETVVPTLD